MEINWVKLTELVLPAVATLLAAWQGAKLAFNYNIKQERQRIRDLRIEECNRAMLVLSRQYNWLLNYRRQFLDPLREDKGRHLSLPPSDPLDFKHWTVNVPDLAFLLQTPAAEMPFILGLLESKFHGVTALINARSIEHREFQRTLASIPPDQAPQSLQDVQAAVGERLYITLERATDQLYALAEDAISSLEATGLNARNVFRTLYPGAAIMGFAPPLPSETLGNSQKPRAESVPV